jgi:hypothetical protein
VFFTLSRLWTFSHFTPVETRRKLVISLIVSQLLEGDIMFSIQERFKVALNACARYIYDISRYQHISEHANRILGCSIDTYYNLRICCAMYRLISSGRPGYLFDRLQFGRSARLSNLIMCVFILCSGCSAVEWSATSCQMRNVLQIYPTPKTHWR